MEVKQITRFPRLDTVLMVERYIKKYDGEFKKRALWEHLPKKMMYQTFCTILDYLLYSRKVSIDSEGKVGWIHYPKSVNKHIKNTELFWERE
ncbi:MAG: hypothetical protein ACLFPL_04250 [Candidatus Nanoarchaeia archaeon]